MPSFSRSSHFGDKKLIPRVKQFLRENRHKNRIDVEEMAAELQVIYRDYKRIKRNSFRNSVRKAYDYIREQDKEFHPQDDKNSEEFRNEDNASESEFSSDNENYIQTEDSNFMNKRLQNMYSANNLAKNTCNSVLADENSASKEHSGEKEALYNTKRKKSMKNRQNNKKMKVNENLQEKKAETFSFGEKSNVTFADIAGCYKAVKYATCILFEFKNPKVLETFGLNPPVGILLHGPPGCGKTLLAYAIAGEMGLPFFKVDATELVSGVSGESEEKIRDLFARATACAPSVVFIDEIDSITPKIEAVQKQMEKRTVNQLKTCFDELVKKDCAKKVLIIGATNLPDSMDPALRRAGRFGHEIHLGIPDENARLKLLELFCKKFSLHAECDLKWVAHSSPGFVGADLKSLVHKTAMNAVYRILNLPMNDETIGETELEKLIKKMLHAEPINEDDLKNIFITKDDFQYALKTAQPSSKREGFATIPDVKWDDIGALKDIRKKLELSILARIHYPGLCERSHLKTPSGILLFGPPGCGKTLVAKAIANETGLNFISVKGAELLNMYLGESERAVRECFQRAKNSAPCIIFFDEIDSLCPQRSVQGPNGYEVRVVAALLTEMDGFEPRKGVFILGATNRPDLMDKAILRPGRFESILYVGIPNFEDRLDILTTITKNGTEPKLAKNVNLRSIAEDPRCDRFTGADLSALVKLASEKAIEQIITKIASGQIKEEEAQVEVTLQHFEEALQESHSSVTLETLPRMPLMITKDAGERMEKQGLTAAGLKPQRPNALGGKPLSTKSTPPR